MELNVDFEKIIYKKEEPIFKLIKTKTNKYYLIDIKTSNIVGTNKKTILKKIYEYNLATI